MPQTQSSLDYLSWAREVMNPDQQEAVARVMQMRDYALVLGMPGTGKTTTIVHIIKVREGENGEEGEAERGEKRREKEAEREQRGMSE